MSEWRWSDEQWDKLSSLLEHGFKGEWHPIKARAWRVVLDELDPELVGQALSRLIANGQIWLPTLGEIVKAATDDPSWPSWPDVQVILFGRRGVLWAEPERQPVPGTRAAFESVTETARDRAVLEAAERQHPSVAAFVQAIGPRRLRELRVDDPDWGQKRLDDLKAQWEEHADACRARARAGMPLALPAATAAAANRELGAGGLRQLNAGELVAGLNGERAHGDDVATD